MHVPIYIFVLLSLNIFFLLFLAHGLFEYILTNRWNPNRGSLFLNHSLSLSLSFFLSFSLFLSLSFFLSLSLSLYLTFYIYAPITGFEHSGEEINGCHLCNAKLLKRIELSGIWLLKI